MHKSTRILEYFILGGLIVWLFSAAWVVQIEYYDGYDSICNAGHFLGTVAEYQSTRGPFFGLILMPAEWLKQRLDWHPLDVRLHHITMAILHSLYLLGSYLMLVRLRGRNLVTLFAFVAAVPTFVFLTYAPFVSHDLLPGVFFLAMLLLAERFMKAPNWRCAVLMILLGALSAMIKHTFALFWFFILGIQLVLFLLDKDKAQRGASVRSYILLALCAVGSGLIAAGTLGWALKGAFPDQGFVERVMAQVKYLTFDAHDKSMDPPWWVYLRNFPAFGALASLLVLPGLWLSWKQGRRMKGLAIAWILSVVVIHLIGIRQVRYLTFVMPITAVLIVPVLQRLMKYREGVPAMLVVMLFTQFTATSPAKELLRPFSDFYRDGEARNLLDQYVFPESDEELQLLISNTHMLSFWDGRNTPLVGDVYHNLFHLHLHHINDLYELGSDNVILLSGDTVWNLEGWPKNSAVILASAGLLINQVDWGGRPPLNADGYDLNLFKDEGFVVTRKSESDYVTEDGRALLIGEGPLNGEMIFGLQADWLVPLSPQIINIRVFLPGVKKPVYGSLNGGNQWLIPGYVPPAIGGSRAVRYFRKASPEQVRAND